jgi:hypothetical protein
MRRKYNMPESKYKEGRYIASHPDLALKLTITVEGEEVIYIDGSRGMVSDFKSWTLTPYNEAKEE